MRLPEPVQMMLAELVLDGVDLTRLPGWLTSGPPPAGEEEAYLARAVSFLTTYQRESAKWRHWRELASLWIAADRADSPFTRLCP